MKRVSCYIIFIFLFGTAAGNAASLEFNERVQQACLDVIRLKFDEGKRLLDEEQRLNPSNALPLLYYSYMDFLKAFISEEKKDFDAFRSNVDKRMESMENDDSPFGLYAQAELMLQDAMLRMKFREFMSAAFEVRKAYRTIERNSVRYPTFLLNKKVTGFLHVLVGSIPKNYRWLVDLAGMKGTISQGTEELRYLLKAEEGTPYSVYKEEILFYLGSIHQAFSKKETESAELAGVIKPLCSESLLMRYCYSNLAARSGKNDEVLQTLSDTASSEGFYPFYFLNYKRGIAKLNKLDYTAEKDFREYISHFHGINYVRSSYQKLAWIYLLNGNPEKYREYMQLCKTTGSSFVDEDKEAEHESTTGEVPNVILLRARLLFDGGYYRESLFEMAGKPIENFPRYRDQLEVTYRFARIFHKMNQTGKAIMFYGQTLKNGTSSTSYFAANSALLLGNIYEEQHDFEKAKNYYNQCLALRNHEYQNSIDQKAAAGLERLNVKN